MTPPPVQTPIPAPLQPPTPTPAPTPVPRAVVAITPSEITLDRGATQRFTATVDGVEGEVRWSMRQERLGYEIGTDGTFTAPEELGAYHVVATSSMFPEVSATAVVRVEGAPATAEGLTIDFSQTKFDWVVGADAPQNGPALRFTGVNNTDRTSRPFLTARCGEAGVITHPQGAPELAPGESMGFKVFLGSDRCSFGTNFTPGSSVVMPVTVEVVDSLTTGDDDRVVETLIVTVAAVAYDAPGPVRVAGRLVDPQGDPVGFATVEVAACCRPRSTQTDGSGAFDLGMPEADGYWVRASAAGYETAFLELGPEGGGDLALMLQPLGDWSVDVTSLTSVSGEIGFWRAAASADGSSLLLPQGMEVWPDRSKVPDSELYLLDTATGETTWTHAMGNESWAADISRDGAFAAVVTNLESGLNEPVPGREPVIRLLDASDGSILWSKQTDGFPAAAASSHSRGVRLSNDGQHIVMGMEPDLVYMLSRTDGSVVWHKNISQNVREALFSADDAFVYVPSGSGFLHKLRVSDGTEVWRRWVGSWAFINGFDLSPNGEQICVGSKSAEVTVLDTADGSLRFHRDFPALVATCRFSNDGAKIAVGAQNGLHLFDIDGNRKWVFPHVAPDFRFGPGDAWLVTSSIGDGTILTINGTELHTFGAGGLNQVGWMNDDGTRFVFAWKDVPERTEIIRSYALDVRPPA